MGVVALLSKYIGKLGMIDFRENDCATKVTSIDGNSLTVNENLGKRMTNVMFENNPQNNSHFYFDKIGNLLKFITLSN